MQTRSFVLDGEPRRFWDISWEGLVVEVTSGVWGTNGRARDREFATPAARDAFIAAEIRKVEKKGYREIDEVAPASEASSSAAMREAQAFVRNVEAKARPAWLPTFVPGRDGAVVVRGPMTLGEGEAWPSCRGCGQPLSALLEIDLSGVPSPTLRADDLVQLFWCESLDRGGERVCTVDVGWLARRQPRAGRRAEGPLAKPSFVVAAWSEIREVPSSSEEAGLEDAAEALSQGAVDQLVILATSAEHEMEKDEDPYRLATRSSGLVPRTKNKLGGWPVFVHPYDEPFAQQVFQLEQGDPFDVNFGDLGAGHLLLRRDGQVVFTWSCH